MAWVNFMIKLIRRDCSNLNLRDTLLFKLKNVRECLEFDFEFEAESVCELDLPCLCSHQHEQ